MGINRRPGTNDKLELVKRVKVRREETESILLLMVLLLLRLLRFLFFVAVVVDTVIVSCYLVTQKINVITFRI